MADEDSVEALQTGWKKLDIWAGKVAAAINYSKSAMAIRAFAAGRPKSADSATNASGDGGGSDDAGTLQILDDAGDTATNVDEITFGFIDADAVGDDPVQVVQEVDDEHGAPTGQAIVTMGVSNQFYVVIDGELQVINLLGDPTEGNGIPRDP